MQHQDNGGLRDLQALPRGRDLHAFHHTPMQRRGKATTKVRGVRGIHHLHLHLIQLLIPPLHHQHPMMRVVTLHQRRGLKEKAKEGVMRLGRSCTRNKSLKRVERKSLSLLMMEILELPTKC